MKITLLLCLAAVGLWAQTQSGKKTTAPAPRSGPVEPKIPAGAVKSEDGSYKFTDAQGKHWTYRETPFGISRAEDKPADATATPFGKSKAPSTPAPVEAPKPVGKELTTAFDEGDTVRFERPTPFGTSVWRKKKTDLDSSEKKIFEDQRKSKEQ